MSLFYGKIRGQSIEFEKDDEWITFTAANEGRKVYLDIGFETRQRTIPQNSSLHLAFTMLATALNDAGLEISTVLDRTMRVPWSADTVKEALYRPLMKAKLGKSSTTELTKDEVSEIYDLLLRELGEKFGVEAIPFPSKETMNG